MLPIGFATTVAPEARTILFNKLCHNVKTDGGRRRRSQLDSSLKGKHENTSAWASSQRRVLASVVRRSPAMPHLLSLILDLSSAAPALLNSDDGSERSGCRLDYWVGPRKEARGGARTPSQRCAPEQRAQPPAAFPVWPGGLAQQECAPVVGTASTSATTVHPQQPDGRPWQFVRSSLSPVLHYQVGHLDAHVGEGDVAVLTDMVLAEAVVRSGVHGEARPRTDTGRQQMRSLEERYLRVWQHFAEFLDDVEVFVEMGMFMSHATEPVVA